MPPQFLRDQLRSALEKRPHDQPLTRRWLAAQLFIDPKTLHSYLDDPEYGDHGVPMGWPPRLGNGGSTPQVIYMVDGSRGELLHVNDTFCEVLGYARQDVIGMASAALLRPNEDIWRTESDTVIAMLEVRAGKRKQLEFRQWVRARDGRTVWLESLATWDAMTRGWLIKAEELVMEVVIKLAPVFVSAGLLDLADGRIDGVVRLARWCFSHVPAG